jgi:ectoine hydroxylase-related dioxygenase (phytanoyl-CoA dioxygenase family)
MQDLELRGYQVTLPIVSPEECDGIVRRLDAVSREGAGTRNLLRAPWCASLAMRIRADSEVAPFLTTDTATVQCILFEKSKRRNWLVPLHQDLSIPVAEVVSDRRVSGWTEKEGTLYAQPPPDVLSEVLCVRLQLDESSDRNGNLRVVPGSHRHGRLSTGEAQVLRAKLGVVDCPVPRGAALMMRPLLLHASSKLIRNEARRVLHFVIAPKSLPLGLRWAHEV